VIEDQLNADAKRYAPATLRNRDAIINVLRTVLPASGTVLEVASGSGEHAVFFAHALPGLVWQPSDPVPESCASIAAWSAEAQLPNLLAPLLLDATATWPKMTIDAVLCINMIHISPWEATIGLFRNAATLLPLGAPLYLYGPFRRHGVATASSNEEFDVSLKERDERWGLRQLEAVIQAAQSHGFRIGEVIDMPANNLSVILRR
jgi:hypothetical protein